MAKSAKYYKKIITNLKSRIRQERLKSSFSANHQLIRVYWEIGKTILAQQQDLGFGAGVIQRISNDLQTAFPDSKGFSVRNLNYMCAFARAWPDFAKHRSDMDINDPSIIVQDKLAQITWYHHITLLDKVKDENERSFYIYKTIENGWSRDVMVHQIETELFKRASPALPTIKKISGDSDLAIQLIRNKDISSYLHFSGREEGKDLESMLVEYFKTLFLKTWQGFAWVGPSKELKLSKDNSIADLLFYNYNYRCFLLVDLKIGDVDAVYEKNLNRVVKAIEKYLRGKEDRPTISLQLYKTPEKTISKYCYWKTDSITNDIISGRNLPATVKAELPAPKELEQKIEEGYNLSSFRLFYITMFRQMRYYAKKLGPLVEANFEDIFQETMIAFHQFKTKRDFPFDPKGGSASLVKRLFRFAAMDHLRKETMEKKKVKQYYESIPGEVTTEYADVTDRLQALFKESDRVLKSEKGFTYSQRQFYELYKKQILQPVSDEQIRETIMEKMKISKGHYQMLKTKVMKALEGLTKQSNDMFL